MKAILKTAAALACGLVACQTHALDVSSMNSASTLKIYFSGSSGTSAVVAGLFTQNCNASTRTDYKLRSDPEFGTIYTCTLSASNDFGLGATNVMFQKRDAGDSGMGVYPVTNNIAIPLIDPTSCTSDGTCGATFKRIPDGGVSDLEPQAFQYFLNTPPGFDGPVNLANVTVDPFVQTIFGLAVSQALYAKLQADQQTTGRPSVPQTAVALLLRSGYPFDSQAWKLLLPNTTDGSESSQVTICRLIGSGTQAAANRFFFEYPVNLGIVMAPASAGDSTVSGHGTTPASLFVSESGSVTGVRSCLTQANTAGGFAVGHVSYENTETAQWKFVKINGQEGGRDRAKIGRYPYFYESTCQYRNALTGSVLTFVRKFCEGSASPSNLASLPASVQQGVMTPPQHPACPGAGQPATTFCSLLTTNGQSLEFPAFY